MRAGLWIVIGAACTGFSTALAAAGGDPPVLVKILADDGAADDAFGNAVAVSGGVAVVGAEGDADQGWNTGSAYLFDAVTGEQLFKLLADDGAFGDYFGHAVGISGPTAIVGAYYDGDGSGYGSAYLFDVATGQQLFKLLPDDPGSQDRFGSSVAISGGSAVVGSIYDDDNGLASGSAYLFDVATGQQVLKMIAEDGAPQDNFGVAVAISGASIIVGARYDNDQGSDSGSAYIFDAATGQQLHKLLPDDGAADDRFGRSVAISGGVAIVGAIYDDDLGIDSGSAYLFDVATGQQLFKLTADDGAAGDWFGVSVAVSGGVAVVGATSGDGSIADSGAAYIFSLATGQQLLKITPEDGAWDDAFGAAVAVSGESAIVAAYLDDDNGEDSGSAYLVNPMFPPSITSPASVLVGPGPSTVVFEVAATSMYPLTYQWRRDGQPLADGGNISGVNTPTLTISATTADIAEYDCEVSNILVSRVSDPAVLGFRPNPCPVDITRDSLLDFFDVQAFLNAFSAGCP